MALKFKKKKKENCVPLLNVGNLAITESSHYLISVENLMLDNSY